LGADRGAGGATEWRAWARRLLASLPDPVFVLDSSGALVFANEGVSRALGWNIDDWIGRNALEVVHPDDLAMALVSLESVGGKAVGSPIDIRLQTADGGWRYFEIVGANLLDDPEIAGIVIVARDLTERRRFEVATNDLSASGSSCTTRRRSPCCSTGPGTSRA
jgi:PAS domain S-box-containing protein